MGKPIGRIEREFVFQSLIDNRQTLELHGDRKEAAAELLDVDEDTLGLRITKAVAGSLAPEDNVRVFFSFKDNYHTFNSRVLGVTEGEVRLLQPIGIYKDLMRKYERVPVPPQLVAQFAFMSPAGELAFPKSDRYVAPEEAGSGTSATVSIPQLVQTQKQKLQAMVTENRVVMMRDVLPVSYEEKVMVKLGRALWIPSTEEDFPADDPFPDERIITRGRLEKYEEEQGTPEYLIPGKLAAIIHGKVKREIRAELYCPVMHKQYVAGYIYLANTGERRQRMAPELVNYVYQFGRLLAYALRQNGYFAATQSGESRFDAQIIDLSASGVLFTHNSPDLAKGLLIHADLDLVVRVGKRRLATSSRITRKFSHGGSYYYGAHFMRMEPEDFRFLFEFLYGKPYRAEYDGQWEGGAPPPPLSIV